MGKEKVFAGQLFGGLKVTEASAMSHQASGEAKADATSNKTDIAKPEATFIEFELQAISKADAAKDKLNANTNFANSSTEQAHS